MSAKLCAICGKKLSSKVRSDARFCSPNCRKAAGVLRKRAEREKASRSLTTDEHADLLAVYAKSKRGYTGLIKLLALYGKDFFLDVLLVVEDVIGDIMPESKTHETS